MGRIVAQGTRKHVRVAQHITPVYLRDVGRNRLGMRRDVDGEREVECAAIFTATRCCWLERAGRESVAMREEDAFAMVVFVGRVSIVARAGLTGSCDVDFAAAVEDQLDLGDFTSLFCFAKLNGYCAC